MNKKTRKNFIAAACLLLAFAVWTCIVCTVDVRPIGPNGSKVGLATVNGAVHRLTGVCLPLYLLTDWLSLIPLGFAAGFAVLGLGQWIRRRRLLAVDRSILILGGFYTLVMAAYVCFEGLVVNFRPVLIDGVLEASYPSSTTVLVLCVMATARLQLQSRIRNRSFRRWISASVSVFSLLMVVGRAVSGVHWLSDIVGGILLSAGLVQLYRGVCRLWGK